VTSKLTAALAQVPAIKKALDTLCTTLAMCKITKITPEVQAFFQKKLSAVTLCENEWKKGCPPVVYDLDLWGEMNLWIQCQQTRKATITIANAQKVKLDTQLRFLYVVDEFTISYKG
jgi:hypothetical protein